MYSNYFCAVGELPEALQSSAESFKSKYGATQPNKDAQLVFSCKGGVRSRKALTSALELGFTK
jgi:rhodanese-related sulfurtransferase